MTRWLLLSGVFICTGIALQIHYTLAFKWENVPTNITACEHEDVRLIWEYKLNPQEYVKAKTWFTGVNKTAKRIAYWKDTNGLKIEPEYTERVEVFGNGNNSLLLRRVTNNDEGMYTLIPNFPLSSEPDPRLTLNLTIYISPLKVKGCCKPDINSSHNKLHASLNSEHGCGKPSPMLTWMVPGNKMVANDTLILGNNDGGLTYKVCLMGPAIERCFDGDNETLCTSYIVPTEQPPLIVITQLPVGAWIGISVVILLVIAVVVMTLLFRKRLQKCRQDAKQFNRLDENVRLRIPLIETVLLDVKSLTKELVLIYKEQSQFQTADSQLKLQTEIYDGLSVLESNIDINMYRKCFYREDHPLKRILIHGEVGCGKKTWCNTLTQEWRKAHAPDIQEQNDNITFLQGYDLLFNISLGKIQKFANSKELLSCLHISMLDQLDIDVFEYVKNHNTIIIIQGLDEYTDDPSNVKNILSDDGLENAVVIITSTPTIWSKNYQDTFVDRRIHVKGLDKDAMIMRAQEILKNDGFPQTLIDEFFRSIESNGLDEFTTEPVFFPYLVEMWKLNCILPCTRSEFLLDVLENQMKGKIRSYDLSADDYGFDFGNNIVLRRKRFISHRGKIVTFLGEIAFRIFINDKNGITLSKQVYDDIFKRQNWNAEDNCQFIIDFCVHNDLVSTESNADGVIQTISFRHKVMMTFLAAIYISTLHEEDRQPYIAEIQSAKDLTEFLRFVSSQSEN